MNRREFVRAAVITGAALGPCAGMMAAEEPRSDTVPQRSLGKTGVKVSMVGLGGYHLGNIATEQESIALIRQAIDRGVTFMDNCWDYHNGKSEIWMGKALRDGYRDKVFLMSKIDGQTRESAARQIDESLQRLQTDHLDLMQLHEMIRPEDPARVFAAGGSVEALLAARQAGKIRFIGFTGHKDPAIHLAMLDMAAKHRVHFDAVQMPLNLMDAHYKSFEKRVLPRLVREKIGVLGMKPLGSGHLLKSHAVSAPECLQYALNLPTSTVITGIESQRDLDQAIQTARNFQPMNRRAVAVLLARTSHHAPDGKYEPFKTTTQFDGTVQNPQWLGLNG